MLFCPNLVLVSVKPRMQLFVVIVSYTTICRGMRSLQQQCSVCLSVMPTPYLLSIHISEQHDSFFASQATQRMHVFRCLVEGCSSTFSSAAQRHQHLTDLHQIPVESGFDRCAKSCFHILPHHSSTPHTFITVKQIGCVSVYIWNFMALTRTVIRQDTARRLECFTSMYV